MVASKVAVVHDGNPNEMQSDSAGRASHEVRPSRLGASALREALERRARAARLLSDAVALSGLSQRATAHHMGIGESHVRRLLAGEAPWTGADLWRLPFRVVEPLLVRALAELRAAAPTAPRTPLQLARDAIDGAATVLRETVAGRPARAAWLRLIAIAEEAMAAEGSHEPR